MTVTVAPTTIPQHGIVRYASIGRLELEAGGYLPDVTLAYETWGTLTLIDVLLAVAADLGSPSPANV